MDLSGIIFVALAIAWAVYLIPRAIQRDEMRALAEPMQRRVRVLRSAAEKQTDKQPARQPAAGAAPSALPSPAAVKEGARKAANRRRVVLAVLAAGLIATSATTALAYTPWWSIAIAGGAIVAFLIIARVTVRMERKRRAAVFAQFAGGAPVRTGPTPSRPRSQAPRVTLDAESPGTVTAEDGTEETTGISRQDLAAAAAVNRAAAADAAMWDPLPMTLPTYVSKAHAPRTSRPVEMPGVTSSGHDAEDSKLAEQADEVRASREAEESASRVAGA